jgi:uncharacterized RDD family membrane protein YckC
MSDASRYDQAATFLEGGTGKRRRRSIVTPEGVALPFELADFGDRATAFAIDLFFWIAITIAFYLVLFVLLIGVVLLKTSIGLAAAMSIILFMGFLVRNLYFIHFELAWQGATPGKRIVGLRVIDRNGGPLLPASVIARNLTREIEAFIPLGILISRGGGSWENLALGVWMLLFSLMPLFNRDRMRGGDMIAGTLVVRLPKRVLLPDLVEDRARYVFQDRHLGAYGAFELQVLEDVLRRANAPEARQLRRDVTEKIRAKIGWKETVRDADIDRFLTDFYAAQRAYLERGQLYGKYRADKNTAAGPRAD